jgi:hypothetical protein
MKKLLILAFTAFFLVSCASEAPDTSLSDPTLTASPNTPAPTDNVEAAPEPDSTPESTENAEATPEPDSTGEPDVVLPSPTATTAPTQAPTPAPTASPTPSPPLSASRPALYFNSEEEFINYVQNEDEGTRSARRDYRLDTLTHYYKFRNPPTGAKIQRIGPGTMGTHITVTYDLQLIDANGNPEYSPLQIRYNPHSIHPNIETLSTGGWTQRPFPEESYIFEEDGLKYYIWAGIGVSGMLWGAEWVYEGYYMLAYFPFRFTAEEVLGYISDLERVEIR